MVSGDEGLPLDTPVAIADLESSALYDATGPLPAGELEDVVVIRGTNNQLTVVIDDGFGGFSARDDLKCAG